MPYETAEKMFDAIVELLEPHFKVFTKVNDKPHKVPSDKMKETMSQISTHNKILSRKVHHLAVTHKLDIPGTFEIVKELDGRLTARIQLLEELAEKDLTSDQVGNYLFKLKTALEKLQNKLRTETGYAPQVKPPKVKPAKSPYMGTAAPSIPFEESSTTRSSAEQVGGSKDLNPQPPAVVTPEPAPSEAKPVEGGSKDRDPAAPPASQASPFPKALEELPIKLWDKELIFKIICFFALRQLNYKQRLYVMALAGGDELLRKYFGKKQAAQHLAEFCDGSPDTASKVITLFRNPESRTDPKYLVEGKYPQLKQDFLEYLKPGLQPQDQ